MVHGSYAVRDGERRLEGCQRHRTTVTHAGCYSKSSKHISIQIQSGIRGRMYMICLSQPLHMHGAGAQINSVKPANLFVSMSMQRNGDIRGWMSPQRSAPPQQATPSPLQPRRRRIIESDSSNEDLPVPLQPDAARIMQKLQIPPPPQSAPLPAPQAPVIELTDDSESDDMYIPLPQQTIQQVIPPETPAQLERQRVAPQARLSEGRRRASARTAPLANNGRNLRRRIEAVAEESELEDDESSECIESDTNAQQLYREAILGVRNARNSRIHMRSNTTPCNVCAIFAQYLQHFIHE